ncbi:MAG: arginase family protein [Sediminibacterium sp.]|nr:arginase family protein [Sediminibacterium sp.]
MKQHLLEFEFLNQVLLDSKVNKRDYEYKIGQLLELIEPNPNLSYEENIELFCHQSTSKYCIFGVADCTGVLANYGTAGCETAWDDFIEIFLNMQANPFINLKNVMVLGTFRLPHSIALSDTLNKESNISKLRDRTQEINLQIANFIQILIQKNKIPIIIGGGHHLAFATIKGCYDGLFSQQKSPKINVLNIDAHLDLRPLEGMHSGNGFSYAFEKGYLHKYTNMGAFENYITQHFFDNYANHSSIIFYSFEDLFVRKKYDVDVVITHILNTYREPWGLEIDLDIIQQVVSSAQTPLGISPLTLKQILFKIFNSCNKPIYISFVEGAKLIPSNHSNVFQIGKLLSLLLTECIK